MKKLVLAIFTSLDGYIEGPNGEFVQPPWSVEVGQAWVDHNLAHAGHLIYGRVNFEFNKGHWTSQAAAAQRETATVNRSRRSGCGCCEPQTNGNRRRHLLLWWGGTCEEPHA